MSGWLRRVAAQAGIRRRFAPHQLRHAHAVELAREGVALNVIQRQLGHANLGTTSIYLQGIDTEEIIATIHARRAPMMSATAGLQLSVTRLPERGSAAHAPQALKRASASRTKASVMKTRPGLPAVPGDRPGRSRGT